MSRVLSKVAQLANTAQQSRADQDLALWRVWKQNPTPTNASALLKQVDPLIQREASKWSGTLARPLLETEGKRLAMLAFQNYDPNMGAALGTHVVNQLQKMSRLSYANQNAARLPENKMLMYHSYHLGHSTLADQLGRAPASDELADHLGWSLKHVETFRREIGRGELLESGGHGDVSGSLATPEEADHTVDFIHHGLPGPQKLIFEHLTGYGGAEVLSHRQIQKKLGLSQGQYSYTKKKLIDHVGSVTGKR